MNCITAVSTEASGVCGLRISLIFRATCDFVSITSDKFPLRGKVTYIAAYKYHVYGSTIGTYVVLSVSFLFYFISPRAM